MLLIRYRIFSLAVVVSAFLFVYRFFLGLPFAYIEVTGRGGKAAESAVVRLISEWSALHLFTRTDRIAQFLQDNTWVERVKVFKSFDGGLYIDVQYRTPVLRARAGQFLVDDSGRLIYDEVAEEAADLPVFHGDKAHARQAFRLWARLGVWQSMVSSLSYDEFSGWTVLLGNGLTVKLGQRHLLQRLDLFLKVAEQWSVQKSDQDQVFDMRYHQSFSHKTL